MKEIVLQAARKAKGQKLNTLREYLQNYILFLIQKMGMHTSLYFVGGSALRFLYRIRRYSEDLDFSSAESWKPSDFSKQMKKMKVGLEKAGYNLSLHLKEGKTVQRAVVRFSDLLYEVGLSPQKGQNLAIAVEVDTNPPSGSSGGRTIVDVHWPVLLQHYDLSSLFATKVAAVMTRSYTKGRDIYDLFWYRTKWKELLPNFRLLNNALSQFTRDFNRINEENWLEVLRQKIESLKWKRVQDDVRPLLESTDDLVAFTKDNLLLVLSR
jgi:predicted nucleotidyltransferase component of viral defense system